MMSSKFSILPKLKTAAAIAGVVAAIYISTSPTIDAAPMVKRGQFSGDGTYYNTGLGACGLVSQDSDYIAALNHPQWGNPPNPNQNPICGKLATVTGPKGTVTVKVLDLCPECLWGSLDLSPAAFNQIADQSQGRVHITWDWADGGGGAPPPKKEDPPPPPPPKKDPPPPPPSPTTTTSTPTPTPTPTTTSESKSLSTVPTTTTPKKDLPEKPPTPTPTIVNSVSWALLHGKVPFLNPDAILPHGVNPLIDIDELSISNFPTPTPSGS
ncbi:hypothetical protein G9A89_010116 [Geosiphon pyriformis]|nr:hypothetical protein G9A89_010116 [Geosiphon pyriformis]